MKNLLQWTVSIPGIFAGTAAVVLATGAAHADPPVEEPRDPLDVLTAAQQTNLAALRKGQMRVKATETHYSVPGTKRFSSQGEGTVLWDGAQQRWETSATHTAHEEGVGRSGAVNGMVLIRTPRQIISYNPGPEAGRGALVVQAYKKVGVPPPFERAQPERWFKKGGQSLDWTLYFDPANEKGRLATLTVRQDGDRIIATRAQEDGFRTQIEASLEQGGNVVAYESHSPPARDGSRPEMVDRGRYDWTQDGHGVWYLKKCRLWSAPADNAETLTYEFTMQVSEFNSAPKLPADAFRVESMKTHTGDMVDLRGKDGQSHKRYRVGVGEPPITPEELSRLAEELIKEPQRPVE